MANKIILPDGSWMWDSVPDGHLRILKEKTALYAREHRANRVEYPNPNELSDLDPDTVVNLGFIGHDLEDLGVEPVDYRGRRNRRNRRNRGRGQQQQPRGKQRSRKQKGSGGYNGGGKRLPNPQVVDDEAQAGLDALGIKPVTTQGDEVVVSWNLENCNKSKVLFFEPTYRRIFACAHFAYLVEVDNESVKELGRVTGKKPYYSSMNSRGQGLGFLVDTNRYEVIGDKVEEWVDVATVQGIQDLRPALVITVKDKITGVTTTRVAVHLKSKRGGDAVTKPVRYQQVQKLAKHMGTPKSGCKPQVGKYQLLALFKNPKVGRDLSDHGAVFLTVRVPSGVTPVDGMYMVAGDWNEFVDTATAVFDPITSIGYLLVYPHDHTSTQSMGGRLDGLFRDVSTGDSCSAPSDGPFAPDTQDSASASSS